MALRRKPAAMYQSGRPRAATAPRHSILQGSSRTSRIVSATITPASVNSAVEPRGHETPPVVVAEVRGKVSHVPLPGRDHARRGAVDVVDVLGQVALDIPDDVAPARHVERASLEA